MFRYFGREAREKTRNTMAAEHRALLWNTARVITFILRLTNTPRITFSCADATSQTISILQLSSQARNNPVWDLKVQTGAQILHRLILIVQKRCSLKCSRSAIRAGAAKTAHSGRIRAAPDLLCVSC